MVIARVVHPKGCARTRMNIILMSSLLVKQTWATVGEGISENKPSRKCMKSRTKILMILNWPLSISEEKREEVLHF